MYIRNTFCIGLAEKSQLGKEKLATPPLIRSASWADQVSGKAIFLSWVHTMSEGRCA